MMDINEQTLKNIHDFINGEGLKQKRIAKKLGMSESNLSDYLRGKRTNIHDFAIRLAKALQLEEMYFMNSTYQSLSSESSERTITFSAGNLSKKGEEGLDQLLRVCDLIETYDIGDTTNA